MENSLINQQTDIRQQFDEAITNQGRFKTWVADQIGMSKQHLNNILKERVPLTEENRKKLNEVLGTNI